jgi:hypothetical protein
MDGRTNAPRASGGCLCGAVRYSVRGPLRDVIICHCLFCRRQSTHVGAYSACDPADLAIEPAAKLRWYRSSPGVQRGFCSRCGALLFWKPEHGRHVSIAAGSIDEPTGLRVAEEIFTAQKGDYYDLCVG